MLLTLRRFKQYVKLIWLLTYMERYEELRHRILTVIVGRQRANTMRLNRICNKLADIKWR